VAQQRYRGDEYGQERRRGEWERSQGGSPGEYGGAAQRGYGSESDWTSERRGGQRLGYGGQQGYGARDRDFDEARGDWGPAGRRGEDDLGARREDYGRWGREELYPAFIEYFPEVSTAFAKKRHVPIATAAVVLEAPRSTLT
jgi:hypothetical protein